MRRILVMGGSGFIGRRCVELLANASDEIHVAGRSELNSLGPRILPHRADLLNPDQVRDLFAEVRPTHLLHLAWVTHPGAYWTSVENLSWVAAGLQMIRLFGEHGGKRAVMVGSCAEYEWARESVCSEDSTPCRPSTLYGTCKNALRTIVEVYAKQIGFSIAWARLFFLYGPFEHPNRLVASVINSILAGKIAACTLGSQQRDFLHVWDAADAVVRLLGTEITGPINVGSGEPVAIATVVRALGSLLGRPELVGLGVIPERGNEPDLIVADVSRLRSELKWTPSYSLQSGLAQTIAWWKAALRPESATP